MAKKKSRIPRFRTDEEERQFWSRHSFEEFADELKELNVNISPPSQEYAKGHKTAASLRRALPSLSLEKETLDHIESQMKARRKHPARVPRF
jgi:hypothetical protein